MTFVQTSWLRQAWKRILLLGAAAISLPLQIATSNVTGIPHPERLLLLGLGLWMTGVLLMSAFKGFDVSSRTSTVFSFFLVGAPQWSALRPPGPLPAATNHASSSPPRPSFTSPQPGRRHPYTKRNLHDQRRRMSDSCPTHHPHSLHAARPSRLRHSNLQLRPTCHRRLLRPRQTR